MKIVLRDSVAIAFGLVFHEVPGATPKKPLSGLIARSRSSASGLSQAMSSPTRPHLPPLEARGGDHHGEVRLAAGRGKGGGDISLLALRVFDAQDEHVLGQPALVTRDVGGDPQREALLAQKRVAAVAGPERPDFARFGKMDDVLLVVAGPGDVLPAGSKGSADAVHARHDALLTLVDLRINGQADPGHDRAC